MMDMKVSWFWNSFLSHLLLLTCMGSEFLAGAMITLLHNTGNWWDNNSTCQFQFNDLHDHLYFPLRSKLRF